MTTKYVESNELHMALLSWKNGGITMVELKKLLDTYIMKSRLDGFGDARLGCTFDSNCVYCTANEMTLKYLEKT